IFSVCMAFLQSGDEGVSSRSIFGATNGVFNKYLGKFGVSTRYVDPNDLSASRDAISGKTKLVFVETPSNPLMEVADIRALAEIAHSVGAKLVVDNCFCAPALQQPLALGADLVVHSATKFLDGQGRALGGAVVGRNDDIKEI